MGTLRRASHFILRDGRPVQVRSATPSDARAVRTLMDASAAEAGTPILHVAGSSSLRSLRGELGDAALARDRLMLVAHVDGVLVGHLVLAGSTHPYARHVCELGIAVAADARGLGVGAALLDVALPWAARHPFSRVCASVFPHNERALRFLEAHGFTREGVRRERFWRVDRYFDEVLLSRPLTAAGRNVP